MSHIGIDHHKAARAHREALASHLKKTLSVNKEKQLRVMVGMGQAVPVAGIAAVGYVEQGKILLRVLGAKIVSLCAHNVPPSFLNMILHSLFPKRNIYNA